jgi:tetratricopeptide (TPR) repeat protein
MAVETRNDEREIAEMVRDGNDERAVRIIFALLDLNQRDVEQRVKLLVDLGQRYVLLALAREDGRDLGQGETVNALIDERLAHSLSFQPRSSHHRTPDALTMTWCHEAIACLSTAIQQAATPPYTAVVTRAAASARIGAYQEALTDLQLAATLATTPLQQAEVYYWRGGILSEQQFAERALQEFSQAHRLCPDMQKYTNAEQEASARLRVR